MILKIQEAFILDSNNLIHGNYQFLIEYFGEDVLESRYNTIFSYLEDYIQVKELEDEVSISKPLLNNLVVDYFVDIYRLKDFQDIQKVNDAKIYAYTAYWLLRRKPLQLVKADLKNEFAFINEEMVVAYLYSFLYSEPNNVAIISLKEKEFKEFENNLLYTFMYRDYSPKMIESLIYAFQAGRAYQYSVDFDD